MTIRLRDGGARVVLLDIEGTTTPIAFVHETLFPYARHRLDAWMAVHRGHADYAPLLASLSAEHRAEPASTDPPPAWDTSTSANEYASAVWYLHWLMDRDRKSPALKLVQGRIWETGYQAGELCGQVFPDVAPAIQRWRAEGLDVAIYSSGSELAQRRLFESLPEGNLTTAIRAFFDTGMGPKRAADSYRRIAAALGHPPAAICFVSDVTAELDAAAAAGCQVVLSVRPGNADAPGHGYPIVVSFDELI